MSDTTEDRAFELVPVQAPSAVPVSPRKALLFWFAISGVAWTVLALPFFWLT